MIIFHSFASNGRTNSRYGLFKLEFLDEYKYDILCKYLHIEENGERKQKKKGERNKKREKRKLTT